MNLRKFARGQDCMIRVPEVCCGNPETVVLCHVRMVGISGIGQKAPDVLAAYGCQRCHDYVDGRGDLDGGLETRRLLLLEGVMRTQFYWVQKDILRW